MTTPYNFCHCFLRDPEYQGRFSRCAPRGWIGHPSLGEAARGGISRKNCSGVTRLYKLRIFMNMKIKIKSFAGYNFRSFWRTSAFPSVPFRFLNIHPISPMRLHLSAKFSFFCLRYQFAPNFMAIRARNRLIQ